MLFGPTLNNMKKSWGWNGSLAWLLSTMVIIGICMLEEIRMREKAGEDYDLYRDKTPFFFPIPGFIKKIFKAPFVWMFKTDRPRKGSQVGAIVGLYTILLMTLSLFWVDFQVEGNESASSQIEQTFSEARADSLMKVIKTPADRRGRDKPIKELASMGEESLPYLI